MATKQEWREYFILMNGREPSFQEFQEAQARGEIDRTVPSQTPPQREIHQVSPVSQPPQTGRQSDFISIFKASIYEGGKLSTNFILFLVGIAVSIVIVPILFGFIVPGYQGLFVLIALAVVCFLYWNQIKPKSPSQGMVKRPQSVPIRQVQGDSTSYGEVTMGEAYKNFWGNYTNFSGRSNRAEYWKVWLIHLLIGIVPGLILVISLMSALSSDSSSAVGIAGFAGIIYILLGLYGLAAIVPFLALHVRRYHDLGLSTAQALVIAFVPTILLLIPVLGSFIYLGVNAYNIILLATPSNKYLNKKEPLTDWLKS